MTNDQTCFLSIQALPARFRLLVYCLLFGNVIFAQKFSVSFPIGNDVYQDSETVLTVLIEGISCDKIAIKCHKGLVSMVGRCQYIYRCKKIGMDTIEVFKQKGEKLQSIGKQIFLVKVRPSPKANLAGLDGGNIEKGSLLAQQGIGGRWFVNDNHWEGCTIDSFNFTVFKNNKLLVDIHNEGAFFLTETKAIIQKLEHNDKVLISNIKGCSGQGGADLKALEFTID